MPVDNFKSNKNSIIEEDKSSNNFKMVNSLNDPRPASELNINFDNCHQWSSDVNLNDEDVISKVRDVIKNRKKYQAS